MIKKVLVTLLVTVDTEDEEIHSLWKILGRIADDSSNGVLPSEDAEVFIGFIE